ncbi:MAG: hypothetical protein U5K84_07815 [Alkalibacterium sp.]|nr:hypothetical protein [Alkalibacterium sp.]
MKNATGAEELAEGELQSRDWEDRHERMWEYRNDRLKDYEEDPSEAPEHSFKT